MAAIRAGSASPSAAYCWTARPLPLDDARLGAGWHAPEAGWRWTAGDAAILAAGAREVAIEVAMTGRYWRG